MVERLKCIYLNITCNAIAIVLKPQWKKKNTPQYTSPVSFWRWRFQVNRSLYQLQYIRSSHQTLRGGVMKIFQTPMVSPEIRKNNIPSIRLCSMCWEKVRLFWCLVRFRQYTICPGVILFSSINFHLDVIRGVGESQWRITPRLPHENRFCSKTSWHALVGSPNQYILKY